MSNNNNGNGRQLTRAFMAHVKLKDLNSALVGLIVSVRDLEARISEIGMTGAQVKVAFTDMFPPAVLFSEELMSMHAMYANICDWLNLKVAALKPHSSRRILMTLAHSLYEDDEDQLLQLRLCAASCSRTSIYKL